MDLLPLPLAASEPELAGVPGGRRLPAPSGTSCRFCGFQARDWIRFVQQAGQPVTACLLCSLCLGLDRPTIAREVTLVWLPEMTQALLIATVRQIHVICRQHDTPPTMDKVPHIATETLRCAWGVYDAFLRRRSAAHERLGTSAIGEAAAALAQLRLDPPLRVQLLGGLRLLPLGRFFDDGIDVYPARLSVLARSASSGVFT